MTNSPIRDKDLDHYQLVMAFENYPKETLDPSVLSSLVDSYSSHVRASFNLALNLPSDSTSIAEYKQCVTIPPPKPYYNKPPPNSRFPDRSPRYGIIEPKPSSPLPLLITAHRKDVDVRQYDIVSGRRSFRKIAMNNEDYVVVVQKFGSTIFLKHYRDKKIDMNDEGHRFERMCISDYRLNASYHQLIEGHIGTLTTLIKLKLMQFLERTKKRSNSNADFFRIILQIGILLEIGPIVGYRHFLVSSITQIEKNHCRKYSYIE
jgi:hypothetical protein